MMTLLSNFENIFEYLPGEVLPLEFESLDKPVNSVEPPISRVQELEERIHELEAEVLGERDAARMALDEVRRKSVEETRAEAMKALEEEVAKARAGIMHTIENFVAERVRYFAEIEGETVSLALAIAERVLYREAAMDPMLLRAAVRVALGKVEDESTVCLRIPEEQVTSWNKILASTPHHELVTVVADHHLATGEAVLETTIGRIKLGITEQLKEIERGFFDVLAKRPQ